MREKEFAHLEVPVGGGEHECCETGVFGEGFDGGGVGEETPRGGEGLRMARGPVEWELTFCVVGDDAAGVQGAG